jgi:hypothetical protein
MRIGYYEFSYGIDTKRIEEVFNSDENELLKMIKKTKYFELLKDYLVNVQKTDPEKYFLEDIIENKPYFKNSNFICGTALFSIFDSLGNKLPYRKIIDTKLIDYYFSESFKIKSRVKNSIDSHSALFGDENVPFYLVFGSQPIIHLVTKRKLLELDQKMKSININNLEIVKLLVKYNFYSYQHIKGMKKNISYCLENNLEMLNGCHN